MCDIVVFASCDAAVNKIIRQGIKKVLSAMQNTLQLDYAKAFVMAQWWSVEGQDTGSGVSKNEDHSRRRRQTGFYSTAADNFLSTPKINTKHEVS